MTDTQTRSQALALLGGAVASSLMDVLAAKGILSNAEVRTVLQDAMKLIGSYSTAPGAYEAIGMLGNMLKIKFPERGD